MYNFANRCKFFAYFANRCEFFAFASACEISNFTIRNNEFAKKISVSHILGIFTNKIMECNNQLWSKKT